MGEENAVGPSRKKVNNDSIRQVEEDLSGRSSRVVVEKRI